MKSGCEIFIVGPVTHKRDLQWSMYNVNCSVMYASIWNKNVTGFEITHIPHTTINI